MFFSTYVLARKDSLATIWLAAHWDKKLTRQDLQKIDLNQSVIQIVHPEVPIALRTSGELLVGVVRVYALKVKHLLKDATDATMTVLRTGTVLVSSKGEILSGKGGVKAADAAAAAAVAPTSGSLLPSSSSAAKNNAAAAAAGAGGGGDSGAAVTLHFAQGAEALREDDFYSILDVLQRQGEDGMLPHDLHHHATTTTTTEADWFSVQPSQFLEVDVSGGLSTTDLLGAVVRGSDGRRSSGSSSKTSGGSSVEAARASTGAAGGPTTAAGDDAGLLFLDVGGALPDDLLAMGADGLADDMLMMRPSAGGAAADLFDLTDPLAAGGGGVVSGEGGEGEVAAAAAAMPRKLKPVNVLDAQSTMMSKADLDKSVQDRSDVVASGDRRHGPLDAAEEAARRTLRTLTAAPTTVAVPLSSSFLPAGLAAVWAAAVQPSVQRALDVETARTSSNAPHSTTTTRLSGAAADPMLPDDDAFFAGGAAAPDSPLAQLDEAEAEPNNNNNNAKTSSRKRGRDATEGENDDASEEMGESALATLAKLRSAKSASTTFQQLLGGAPAVGVDRATAAKTFVDVLALASRQMVRVQQKEPFGAIQIQLVRAQ